MPGEASLTYRRPAVRAASCDSTASTDIAAIFEAIHVVGPPYHRLRHVSNGDSAGSDALLDTSMSVAVKGQRGAGPIDGLAQQVAAQERVDLGPLALECLIDRGVVHERHPDVGVEAGEGHLQRCREVLGVPNERLHLGLPEVAPTRADEAAPESLRSRDPQATAAGLDYRGLSFQHFDTGFLEDFADFGLPVGLVVVVAQHRH